MFKSARSFLIAAVLILLTGCAAKSPISWDRSSFTPMPTGAGYKLLEKLNSRPGEDRGRMRSNVTIKSALGTQEFLQSVVFEKPDRLRLEVFAPAINQLQFILVAKDGRFVAVDRVEQVAYTGIDSAPVLSQVLEFPLSSTELRCILLGHFCLSDAVLRQSSVELWRGSGGEANSFVMEIVTPDSRVVELLFSLQRSEPLPWLTAVAIWNADRTDLLFSATVDYERASGQVASVIFDHRMRDVDGRIDIEGVAFEPREFPERMFTLRVPNRFQVLELSEPFSDSLTE